MAQLRRPILGMTDAGGGYPHQPQPAMGPNGQPMPNAMPTMAPPGSEFNLPAQPNLEAADTAQGGQTNESMINQLTAMLNQGLQPQDALQALSGMTNG